MKEVTDEILATRPINDFTCKFVMTGDHYKFLCYKRGRHIETIHLGKDKTEAQMDFDQECRRILLTTV